MTKVSAWGPPKFVINIRYASCLIRITQVIYGNVKTTKVSCLNNLLMTCNTAAIMKICNYYTTLTLWKPVHVTSWNTPIKTKMNNCCFTERQVTNLQASSDSTLLHKLKPKPVTNVEWKKTLSNPKTLWEVIAPNSSVVSTLKNPML